MSQHNAGRIFLILLSLATYVIMLVFNTGAVSGAVSGRFTGIFLQTVGNISNKFNTEFTPATWTFALTWNTIYIWQFLWFGYALSGLCRRNEHGWVYLKPDVLPVSFYMMWMLNNVFNIGWLFLWDREHIIAALVFLAVIAFTSYGALYISYRALFNNGVWLQKNGKADLWLIRILVQNGIAIYATWTTIATLLNFAVVLIYGWGMPNETACTVALAILAFELLLWFLLENAVLDQYVRYTLTVYPVVIVTLAGSISKNYVHSAPRRNNLFSAVLLAAAALAFILRLTLVLWRHFKRPLYLPKPDSAY